jgi:hypothetical protein
MTETFIDDKGAKHYEFGGSGANRTLHCPGWVQKAKVLPQQPSSSAANRGTELHAIMEQLYSTDIPLANILFTSDDYKQAILAAHKQTEAILDAYNIEYLQTEYEVQGPRTNIGGTIDLLGWTDTVTLVADFKFGHSLVPATSPQLYFYAWCLDKSHPELVKDKIVLAVIQPARGVGDTHEITRKDLKQFEKSMLRAINLACKPDAPMDAGSWCQFCPVAPYCEVQQQAAMNAINLDPKDRSTLEQALTLAKQLDPWIKQVFGEAQAVLSQGQPLTGWKLVEKRALRKWSADETVITATLNAKFGIPFDDMFDHKLLSVAQMEKLLKNAGNPPDAIKDLTIKESSGLTLAEETDKREAVNLAMPENLKKLVRNSK